MALIKSVTPSGVKRAQPAFPRVMWADYDPADKSCPVVVFNHRVSFGNTYRNRKPGWQPIRVLVVALEREDQSAISEAIDVLNLCAEQGHDLNQRKGVKR